jgi:hypothetical protein
MKDGAKDEENKPATAKYVPRKWEANSEKAEQRKKEKEEFE